VPGKIHNHGREGVSSMIADKIRTADLPAFRLETRDAVVVVSLIGVVAYVLGFLVGLTF